MAVDDIGNGLRRAGRIGHVEGECFGFMPRAREPSRDFIAQIRLQVADENLTAGFGEDRTDLGAEASSATSDQRDSSR